MDTQLADIYEFPSKGQGPNGKLPITEDDLLHLPSGDLFGFTQNAGMGWNPDELNRKQFLILSTQGGVRATDGSPIALGYHTGHWEIGLLVQAAALELTELKCLPFAAYCSDPCDGRTQGTTGMMDSLPYRNDAAIVFRRLIRSLPTRRGVLGIATCDKGLPAMLLALASQRDLPVALIPGGVTLPADGAEDAGTVQTLGARFSHGMVSLSEAAEMGCRACGSAGGGCQFLGTAATAQVVAEALGLTMPHAALCPSGAAIWLEMARETARALVAMENGKITGKDILTSASIRNAMVVHAAFGGSTNLLLHTPAIAFAAGIPRPTVQDWMDVNRSTPRLVDALPNGPVGHPTVKVFMAGGVPEVMLHLRRLGLLDTSVLTITGKTLDANLNQWENSKRRTRLRERLMQEDGIDPDTIIYSPSAAKSAGLTSTVTFPTGNLAPEGAVIKSTSIDPSVVDPDGVYRKIGPAKVFTSERDAIAAIKGQSERKVIEGDVLVLICRGPLGAGMEEIYQITSALKHLKWGKHVAVITDARFSGVSTGACIGHVGPEALAGGPIGKVIDNDILEIIIDRKTLVGTMNIIGEGGVRGDVARGNSILASRQLRPDLHPDPRLPDDTRLWAALQSASGGAWGGCVYDVDAILEKMAI